MLDRIIAHTPLGQEQLLFRSLDGIEALSTPFDFSIELLSTDARLDRKALLGQPLTLEIPTQGFLSAPRYLNGKITAIAVSSEEIGGTRYAVYSLHVQAIHRVAGAADLFAADGDGGDLAVQVARGAEKALSRDLQRQRLAEQRFAIEPRVGAQQFNREVERGGKRFDAVQ